MTFFDSLSEAIANKGKEAAEAAKKMAEIANLKTQISGINAEIKKNYTKIGEAYFESFKDSEVTCEFEEQVQSIRDARKAIQELEKKIHDLKGTTQCESCGSQINSDSAFCPKCGAKVEVEEVEYYDEEDDADVVEAELEVIEEVVEDGMEAAVDGVEDTVSGETVNVPDGVVEEIVFEESDEENVTV